MEIKPRFNAQTFPIFNFKKEKWYMFNKIKKFFGFSDGQTEEKVSNSGISEEKVVDTGEKVSNFSISEGKVSLDDTKVVEEEMKRVLLDDVRESGIREGIISETMSEYKIRKRKEKQRAAREVKEVISRRANINDMYMMERFGIKGKGGLCYPNFMAVNFSGFMVGKEVDTNKIVVFAGVNDVNSRHFTVNGRKITYNYLSQNMDTGKVMKGYLWYRVLDLGILKEMYEVGDFIDEASRVWLSDYFSYLEFIEKYRKDHPGEKLEIDEIEREIK